MSSHLALASIKLHSPSALDLQRGGSCEAKCGCESTSHQLAGYSISDTIHFLNGLDHEMPMLFLRLWL